MLMRILHQAISIILLLSSFSSFITKAHESHHYNQTCGTGKSAKKLDFPFGFSITSPIPLNCTKSGIVKLHDFHVMNVTSTSIFLHLPAKCNRSITSISQLFGSNYAPTVSNGFLLQNCENPLNECVITTSFVERRFRLKGCSAKSDNISCYAHSNDGFGDNGFLSYENIKGTKCEHLFSSVAAVDPDRNSLQFQTLELGWWVRSPLKCSGKASNQTVNLPHSGTGFRCQCHHGFVGDGFADGSGCRRVLGFDPSSNSDQCSLATKIGILVGGIFAGASIVAGVAVICYVARRWSTSLRNRMSAKRLLYQAAGSSSVPIYDYQEIERATSGFSERQRLGNGAYGTVYAGKLYSNEWVAIKKIKHSDTDSIDQVMNEVKLLSSVSHPSLVRLLGCCIEKGEQILVYEYMPNGTLSQHLQRERDKGLPWTIRLTIAAETARAIAYLHSVVNPPIYHRDIKSSNILLDYQYKSKVADFGLSRLGMTETDDSHISTAPQGTPGYLDPQYHQNFHLSDKSDVYSFGVVLVEIITGLKVVDFSRPHTDVNLAALAIDRIGRGCVDEIIDPFLEPQRDAWTLSSVFKVAELAFRCLAFHKDMRPSMMEVAEELEHIRLSRWAPMEENVCTASSVASSCPSPFNGSEKSLGAMSIKKSVVSQTVIAPQKAAECLSSVGEEKERSPVSVQDVWLSDQSSPSSSGLLGSVVR